MVKVAKGKTVPKRKVAIFDIDGTIFRSSLLAELVDVLIERKLFPESARAEFEGKRILWLKRKGDYYSYIMAVVNVFKKHMKGIYYGDMMDASREVLDRKKDYTYVYTRQAIDVLKKKGYFLLAISLSPKFIVDLFAKHFGFDKSYGIFYATGATEKFTGATEFEDLMKNKKAIIHRAVEKENLTLEDSYGFGDTDGDISLLETVKNPIAMNPNVKLLKIAHHAGWRIIEERKDVILELRNGKYKLIEGFEM
jgi:HAD superfamily hydrolase (TIGR01490 family)